MRCTYLYQRRIETHGDMRRNKVQNTFFSELHNIGVNMIIIGTLIKYTNFYVHNDRDVKTCSVV